jgi:aminoglycoside/choline kinase family phosphotransferase
MVVSRRALRSVEHSLVTGTDQSDVSSWLRERGRSISRLEPLTGDVSARRYTRVRFEDGRTAIVASYPAELRDGCQRFERSTAMLLRAAVAVPRILESDCERGLMLLEDAGTRTLFDLRRQTLDERLPLIETALEVVTRVAALDPAAVAELNPRLDQQHLRRELQQTLDAFLEPNALLGGGALRGDIERAFDRLCAALGEAPPVPCHRDFMARNLVPGAGGVLFVLDHQDLRLGPPSYDLSSLLNDSFFPPHDLESRWVAPHLSDASAERGYHRAAAQRTLKAVGTFAAFAARGFERHLPLIPPTLERALHHLALAPETAAAAPELERLWRPWINSANH